MLLAALSLIVERLAVVESCGRCLDLVDRILFTPLPGSKAWRERRRAERGLCPACGYDLTGNRSGTCPECGTPAAR